VGREVREHAPGCAVKYAGPHTRRRSPFHKLEWPPRGVARPLRILLRRRLPHLLSPPGSFAPQALRAQRLPARGSRGGAAAEPPPERCREWYVRAMSARLAYARHPSGSLRRRLPPFAKPAWIFAPQALRAQRLPARRSRGGAAAEPVQRLPAGLLARLAAAEPPHLRRRTAACMSALSVYVCMCAR